MAVHADLLADLKSRPSNALSLFELDLAGVTRGYSEAWAAASNRLYEGLLIRSGQITRSISDRSFNLPRDSAQIQIYDKDRALEKVLMGTAVGSVSGSSSRIKIGSRTLVQAKWFTVFGNGIINNFGMASPRIWNISLKRDDRSLLGLCNIPTYQEYDWPNAPVGTLGTPSQIVYGKQNDDVTDIDGLVPCAYVDNTASNYRYVVSFGPITAINKVYSDGTLKALTSDYTVDLSYFNNGRYWSVISFVADQGDKAITCDCQGLTDSGLIQNPATQLEHFLTNFVFGDWGSTTLPGNSAWLSASNFNIDETYFAETESFLSDKDIAKGSRVITAGRKGIDVLNEWTKQFQIPSFWTYAGDIAVRPDDHTLTDTYIESPFFRQDISPKPEFLSLKFDASKLIDEVRMDYMYSESTGDFQRHLTLKDDTKNYNTAESLQLHWRESDLSGA